MDILQLLMYIITIAAPLVGVAVKIGQYTKTIENLTDTVKMINNKLKHDYEILNDHEHRIKKLEQKERK